MSASPYDPIFLLNHSFIDYLWALWQSFGHWGDSYYHKPSPGVSVRHGHKLDDPLWPWDQGESRTHKDLRMFIPDYSAQPVRRPRDTLDCRQLGYTYTDWTRVKEILDALISGWTLKNGQSPGLTAKHGVLAFSWGTPTDLAAVNVFAQYPLIEASKTGNGRGFETNLVQALLRGVDGWDQMPLGGPFLTDKGRRLDLAEISHWIDMGIQAILVLLR